MQDFTEQEQWLSNTVEAFRPKLRHDLPNIYLQLGGYRYADAEAWQITSRIRLQLLARFWLPGIRYSYAIEPLTGNTTGSRHNAAR